MSLQQIVTGKDVEKGKNFSTNNLGQRKPGDFYETPYSMTQQLLDHHSFDIQKTILEPAKGGGAIEKVLRRNGFSQVVSYDKEVDFLKETRTFHQAITNPPFSIASEFIKKAKEVIENQFAMLLPLSYLHGKQRLEEIYRDTGFPLAYVYVFCRYPMLGDPLREDGKYKTGMMVYAWYVWNKNHIGNPIIHWIDNDQFILRKLNRKYDL
jgi:hypothetical protein